MFMNEKEIIVALTNELKESGRFIDYLSNVINKVTLYYPWILTETLTKEEIGELFVFGIRIENAKKRWGFYGNNQNDIGKF